MKIRTVITGHDTQGQACVTADREVEATTVPLMPGYGFHMLWSTAAVPTFPDDGSQTPCTTYFPPQGGSRFLVFTIPAERRAPPEGTDLVQAAAQARAALPGLLETMEPNNPGMHRSDTIDYVFVLEGEIVLELDAGLPDPVERAGRPRPTQLGRADRPRCAKRTQGPPEDSDPRRNDQARCVAGIAERQLGYPVRPVPPPPPHPDERRLS